MKRKTYRKKRPAKAVSWYNKKYSPLDIAGKAWQGVKYLKSIVNVERKVFDLQTAFSVTDGNGVLTPLTLIAIGDAYNQRDGNSIKLMSNYITLRFLASPAATTTNIRYMIIQDTEYNGSALSTSQILESNVTVTSVISPLHHTIGTRLKVLCDKYVHMDSADQSSAIREVYTDLDHHIKFDDANITTTTLREGHLYLLTISDLAVNQPACQLYNRVRFVDN